MTRRALSIVLLALCAAPAAAQHAGLGPELAVGDYREVSAGLRYRGVGGGLAGTVGFRRFSLDGAIVWIEMKPSKDGQATESFRATQIDGWLRWDATDYLSLEAGLTKRSANSEFAAQSVGAVRVGARTHYLLGRGTTIWLRGNYLAGARFSGGGRAPFALELGLGLDVALSRRLRAVADYSFQRLDRKTSPGGGPEVSAPIQQAMARVGLALGF